MSMMLQSIQKCNIQVWYVLGMSYGLIISVLKCIPLSKVGLGLQKSIH